MKRVFQFTSALLAGAVALSLAACTAPDAGEPAGGSTGGTAAQTDAPQGRWVEQQAEGIPSSAVIGCPPAVLDDGSLVLYGRDDAAEHPIRLTSNDNGLTWQTETPVWADQISGTFSFWAVRGDGTVAFVTHEYTDADQTQRTCHFWLARPDGTLTELPLGEELPELYAVTSLCFLADGTLAIVPVCLTDGVLPGDLLFYDVEAQQAKAWISAGGPGQFASMGLGRISSICPAVDEDGTAFLYYLSDTGELCRANVDGTVSIVKADFLANVFTSIALDNDGAICYADSTGIYRRVLGGGLTEQVVDGNGTALSLTRNYISDITALPDGSYLVLLTEGMRSLIYRYSFDPTVSAPTETLNVWSLNEDATVRAAIQSFAQSHPEYSVEYEVALNSGGSLTSDDALRTLNTELLAGDGPDVLILDGADLDAFADSGLLADLSGAVDTGALLDFVAEDYVQGDGSIPMLPARFSIPIMVGRAGTLDGVSTLDDVLALVQQHAPRPAEASWAPLEENERYALGFSNIYSVAEFAVQTSQPMLLQNNALDEAVLRQLLTFIAEIGSAYGMADYPSNADLGSTGISWGGLDYLSWPSSMSEYIQAERAVYGWCDLLTPAYLAATSPADDAADSGSFSGSGQVILQPGLCQGVYKPSCFVAVNAASAQPDAAMDFAAVLFGDNVQNEFQRDGLPVTESGIQAYLDRNRSELEDSGYTGGFEELLDQLSTPVVPDRGLISEVGYYAGELAKGSLTLDEAVAGVQDELALYFAERQ